MSNAHRLTTTDHVKTYAMAGNCRLTLVSTKTGQRFTFRIRAPKEQRGSISHFVSLMTGPDNENSFTYIGLLKSSQAGVRFEYGHKSKISREANSVKAFTWFWQALMSQGLPATVECWHEGRCGRCGRALTVPESIASGLGPECAGRVGFLAEAV